MHELNHRHMAGTAYVNRPPLSAEEGEAWLRELVSKVEMEILMEPRAVYCADPENEGVTGIVGLTTSHSSFHCWHTVERPFIMFDLYSCRHFEAAVVVEHLKAFGVEECRYVVLDRNHGRNKVVERSHGVRATLKKIAKSLLRLLGLSR